MGKSRPPGVPKIPSLLLPILLYLLGSATVIAANETRISCFIIGVVNPSHNPFSVYFDKDPLFRYSVEPVPPYLPIVDKQKLDRLYYPRTREDLIEGYEFMVFADPWIDHFTRRQIHDLDYVFREAGMGASGQDVPAKSSLTPKSHRARRGPGRESRAAKDLEPARSK